MDKSGYLTRSEILNSATGIYKRLHSGVHPPDGSRPVALFWYGTIKGIGSGKPVPLFGSRYFDPQKEEIPDFIKKRLQSGKT